MVLTTRDPMTYPTGYPFEPVLLCRCWYKLLRGLNRVTKLVQMQKNRKKNEQAEPTEQLQTTPKSLIFDVNDGDQNA